MLRLRSPECINAFIKAEYCSEENCSCLDIFPIIKRKEKTPNVFNQYKFEDDSVEARLLFLFRILKVIRISASFDGGNDSGNIQDACFSFEEKPSVYMDPLSNSNFFRLFEDFSVQFESHKNFCTEDTFFFNIFINKFEKIVYSEFGNFAGEYTVAGTVSWDIPESIISMTGTEYDETVLTAEFVEEYDRLEEEWREELHEKIKDKKLEELDNLSSIYEYEEKYESREIRSEIDLSEEVNEMIREFETKNPREE